MAEKWIAGAIKKPGSFRAAAKRAGESTMQFAKQKKNSPSVVGKRARLALTLNKLRPK